MKRVTKASKDFDEDVTIPVVKSILAPPQTDLTSHVTDRNAPNALLAIVQSDRLARFPTFSLGMTATLVSAC
jgi:hypothetical protein